MHPERSLIPYQHTCMIRKKEGIVTFCCIIWLVFFMQHSDYQILYLHKKKSFFFLVFLIFLFLSIHFNMRFLRKDYMRYFGNRKSDCISYSPTVEFVSVKVVNAEKYFSWVYLRRIHMETKHRPKLIFHKSVRVTMCS